MISKIPPRRSPVRAQAASTAAKKLAARATGYAQKSSFETVKKVGQAIGKVAGGVREARRDTMRDFKDIKRGLRTGNDPAVKVGVASTSARLNLKLPDLAPLTGWGAFGKLGDALGHVMRDRLNFNRDDYRGVMKMASGRINDPDPSNGRVL
ncbi:MAG: hypothetical protein H6Q89_5513 [Myxococcaceae bacterium]|nr:hypothetical protein [Myxococcaceae bacterium]